MMEFEAQKPIVTEAIVRKNAVNLLRFILPDENYGLEVVKGEGDYISELDPGSKLPRGYELVRIYSLSAPAWKFGEDLAKINGNDKPSISFSQIKSELSDQTPIPDYSAFGEFQGRQWKKYQRSQTRTEGKKEAFSKKEVSGDMDSKGYFKTLNLTVHELDSLSVEDAKKLIKKNYREVANVAHPDRGGSNEAMVKVNLAFEVISNPASRAAYKCQSA